MSSNSLVYLKRNAVAGPLVSRWYAWSFIVPLVTTAMYLANHHLKVTQSFIRTPQVHVEAMKKPEMSGGPFMNYDESRVDEVQALFDRTRNEQADLIDVVPSNNAGNLADPSLKLMLQQLGFRDVRSLEDLERLELDGRAITALPFIGEHGDLDVHTKAAHLLEIEGHTLLLAADSSNREPALYAHVHALVGDVETIFLGMECSAAPMSWLYGPLLIKPLLRKNDQTRRLDGSDFAKAIKIVDQFSPKNVYIYAMGAAPRLTFISSISLWRRVTPDRRVQTPRGGVQTTRHPLRAVLRLQGHHSRAAVRRVQRAERSTRRKFAWHRLENLRTCSVPVYPTMDRPASSRMVSSGSRSRRSGSPGSSTTGRTTTTP